jgi:MFS family permease
MLESSTVEQQTAQAVAGHAPRGRYWTLGVLAVVAFLASVDRQAFSVLLVPIQRQLQVSDGAMGFLTGSAFTVAQAVFMLPLARIADRANRRNVLAIALAIWGVATALSGLAGAFVSLLLARMIVGAAEAAQPPTTVSLVADLFGRNRRGAAFSAIAVGTALGLGFGEFGAGILSDRYSWHVALLVVGLPALIVAAVLFLTVPEPARSLPDGGGVTTADPASLFEQLRQCLAIRTLRSFIIGYIALQAAIAGWLVWFPAFLMRVHGLSASSMGATIGATLLCGMVSNIWSGQVGDILARRGPRWRLYFIVAVLLVSVPILFASSLVPALLAAQACVMTFMLLSGGLSSTTMAAYSSLSPPNMRALVSALVVLPGAVGGVASPAALGLVNDALSQAHGAEALRYTLVLVPALLAVSALFFWISSRTADEDTAAAERCF